MSQLGLAFPGAAIAPPSQLAIPDFLANSCVQASEEAIDFRRVIFN
jgi:hypothetical protein